MINPSRLWNLDGSSTLDDLRQIVRETEDLPGDSEVRARTRFPGTNGGTLKTLHVAPPEPRLGNGGLLG